MKTIGLAVGLPVAAMAAFLLFYSNLLIVPPTLKDAWTFDNEEAKQLIHKYTNEERVKHGYKPLEYDNALAIIAQRHSEDMASNHFFEHENLKGEDPSDRALKAGYSCYKDHGLFYTEGIAENLIEGGSYYGDTSEYAVAKESVKSWMESPGHRANILNSSYDKEGFGIAEGISQPGRLYITQNFC